MQEIARKADPVLPQWVAEECYDWLKSVGSGSSHSDGCSSSNRFRIAFISVSLRNSDLFDIR